MSIRKVNKKVIKKVINELCTQHNLLITNGITKCTKCNFKYISYLSRIK